MNRGGLEVDRDTAVFGPDHFVDRGLVAWNNELLPGEQEHAGATDVVEPGSLPLQAALLAA
jgi:hypothetical protein